MRAQTREYPPPPIHLSDRSKMLWDVLVGRKVRSPGRIVMFQEALEALDLADEARETRIKEGLVTVTERSGVSHVNPILKIERENRQLFVKIWGTLDLYWDTNIDGYM